MDAALGVRKGQKFTERALKCEHPVTKRILEIVSGMNYEVFEHSDNSLDKTKPIFTLILTMHDAEISYIKESLKSVFGQSYSNTEVILVNNGAHGVVGDLIWQHFVDHKNAKLIQLPVNLYNPVAPILHDPIPNLWNAALFSSQGDFVYFMAYDDFVSLDYAERMVKLYLENENCCTAAPLVVSVDENSKVNKATSEIFRKKNSRGRFTDGVELARSLMRGGDKIIFPGGLLSVKSNLVLECGGFDIQSDLSQIFKLGIHGVSGFDPEAKLYWRHHSQQTNKIQTKMGLIYYQSYKDFEEVYDIERYHRKVAGDAFADEYQRYSALRLSSAVNTFRSSYRAGLWSGLVAFVRICKQCPISISSKALYYLIKDFPIVVYTRYLPWAFARKCYRYLKRTT